MTAERGLVVLGAAMLVTLLGIAALAPWISPYDPDVRSGRPFARPDADHWLGTNDIGQDLLSQVFHGARVSLAIGFGAAIISLVVGVAVGVVAGYRRGWTDALLMRLVDVTLSLPFLPVMIVVGAFIGGGLVTGMTVIALVMWAPTARAVRAQVLSVRELDHVAAARSMGGGTWYVARRHVLAELAPLLVAKFVLAAGVAILAEASLSFLGFGDPTAPSWGTILYFAQARSAFLSDAWLWWVVPPGVGIAATIVSLAFIGHGIERRGQPGRRRRHASTSSPGESAPADGAGVHIGPAAVLDVAGLSVSYGTTGPLAVSDVSASVGRGEIVGIVGASGSGKSTLVSAATGMLPVNAAVTAGTVRLCGVDVLSCAPDQLRRLRGDRVAVVPQNAMAALNPVHRIGAQITEAMRAHRDVPSAAAERRVRELLELVGIPPDRANAYPHEFSGGMRQRAVLAMALANDPDLLVADEPTTGLDVVVADEILILLADLQQRLGLAVIVVSHDLPVVLRVADRVLVMHHGEVVEQGPIGAIASAPAHPYTRALLDAVPRLPAAIAIDRSAAAPRVLEVIER